MRTRKRKALSDSANVSQEATAAQKMTPEFSIAKHLLLSKETNGAYKNVVFSPLCIKLLLSIVAAGSSGPVRDQLLSFLRSESMEDLNSVATRLFSSVHVDGSSSGGPCLSFANGVWIDKSLSLKASFSQVLENIYKPALASLDFTNKVEVAKEINSWAERETEGLINNIIDPRSIKMKNMVMANALYFKGLWRTGEYFKKTNTVDGDFHLLDGGGSVKVCSESESLESMLPSGIKRLSALEIPRFKLSFMVDASPVLKEMGLVLPFMEGALTEMVEGRDDAHVYEIIQKCIIEVNEEGTKAAATGRMMLHTMAGRGGKKEPPMEFIADHPFFFMIREQITGTTLFIGQVLNPLHA